MSKVAVITFHASDNCGSMLQAYALQQRIMKIVPDCEIIDFANIGSRRMYGILPYINLKRGIHSGLALWLKSLPYYIFLKQQKEYYKAFSDKYLIKTPERYTSNEELKKANFDYTHFITGSDQVWNVSCYDADDAYFLPFKTKAKKIAFAVSLGSTRIAEKVRDVEIYKSYIEDFDKIAVREFNAIKQVEDLGARNVEIVLDPSLLLSQEEWEKKIKIGEPIVKGNYIFYYAFHYKPSINKVINEIGRKYDMPVYIIDAKAWGPQGARHDGLQLSKKYGPVAFLNLVKNARLCLTTSFHGTAFSVIFKKDFWFVESPMHSQNDDRVSTLTRMLGLEERHISIDKMLLEDLLPPIDYKPVFKKLEGKRQESMTFLTDALS